MRAAQSMTIDTLRDFEVDMAVREGLKRTATEYAAKQPVSIWGMWEECAKACAESDAIDQRSLIAIHTLAAWREMHR